MKNVILVFSLFLGFIISAQEKLVYVEYDHGQFVNGFSNNEVLIAGSNKAIYNILELKSIENNSEQMAGKNIKKLDFNSIKPTSFHKSKNSNIIYFDDYIDDKQYFIKDTLPNLNWELLPDEKKEIQGYVCQKAKLKYRGSEFTAYYTLDIPIKFGPWKFDGLPGLIMEIQLDDDNNYYWKATKVIYPSNEEVNFKINKELYKNSLRTFLNDKKKDTEEKQRIFDEKFADGAVIIRNYKPVGPEKVYEWESKN